LPGPLRSALRGVPGHTLERIRIHDDAAAHDAAQGLGARAFTVGTAIYFARGNSMLSWGKRGAPLTRRRLSLAGHH
jgi:hypothetical protein